MPYLLDVNLLIALAWPSHIHHQASHRWFAEHAQDGWATCPITQCGFVRISSNPAIIRDAVTPRDAIAALRQMLAHPQHQFWPDELPLTHEHIPATLLMGHRQVTDAYLLGLAIHRNGKLATHDRGVCSLLRPAQAATYIELIAV